MHVQSLNDPALVARLAMDGVPLTVCPLSNLKLCAFSELRQRDPRQGLDAGLCATVNSDDLTCFGGYPGEPLTQSFEALGMTAQHAWRLAHNSLQASFAPEANCRRWVDELEATFDRFAAAGN